MPILAPVRHQPKGQAACRRLVQAHHPRRALAPELEKAPTAQIQAEASSHRKASPIPLPGQDGAAKVLAIADMAAAASRWVVGAVGPITARHRPTVMTLTILGEAHHVAQAILMLVRPAIRAHAHPPCPALNGP